jgi:hypothetical protein
MKGGKGAGQAGGPACAQGVLRREARARARPLSSPPGIPEPAAGKDSVDSEVSKCLKRIIRLGG